MSVSTTTILIGLVAYTSVITPPDIFATTMVDLGFNEASKQLSSIISFGEQLFPSHTNFLLIIGHAQYSCIARLLFLYYCSMNNIFKQRIGALHRENMKNLTSYGAIFTCVLCAQLRQSCIEDFRKYLSVRVLGRG